MTIALSCVDLRRRYRAGVLGCSAHVDALRGVNLEIRSGEIVGLLGPNGAGKTTLLLCAAALLRPDSGRIAWYGSSDPAQAIRHGIGFVPERSIYYSFLTVRETLEYYGSLHELPGAELRDRVSRLLESVGLADQRDKRVTHLSRGMLQRLGLAQALIGSPRLLLLDETLSGLDPVGRRDVRELIRQLPAQGVTVVLSSHDMTALEQITMRVVVLVDGAVRASMEPVDLEQRLFAVLDEPSRVAESAP